MRWAAWNEDRCLPACQLTKRERERMTLLPAHMNDVQSATKCACWQWKQQRERERQRELCPSSSLAVAGAVELSDTLTAWVSALNECPNWLTDWRRFPSLLPPDWPRCPGYCARHQMNCCLFVSFCPAHEVTHTHSHMLTNSSRIFQGI